MKHVVLDTGPLSLITQRAGVRAAETCRAWYVSMVVAGWRVYVPEIADYELRRELIRSNKPAGLSRLDALIAVHPENYIPITTVAMRTAAQLWAEARQRRHQTAPDASLDADVILAAQTLSMGAPRADIVVATTNVAHIEQFVSAELWTSIQA